MSNVLLDKWYVYTDEQKSVWLQVISPLMEHVYLYEHGRILGSVIEVQVKDSWK